MNKKRKKLILLIIGIPFITGILFSIWFVLNVKIYGTITVSYKVNSEDSLSSIYIKAHTPTGREVFIPFVNNKAALSGFFKDATVLFPCNDNINSVTIENNWKQNAYPLKNKCLDGKMNIAIPEEMVIGKSFLNKSFALFNWFFSVKTGQEIIFCFLVLFILVLSYFLYKQVRRKAKTEPGNLKKKLLKHTIVFLSGFVFWIIVIFVIIEAGLRIFGYYYYSKQIVLDEGVGDSTITVLCIGDSYTYGIGAHSDKSYPSQLAGVIKNKENIPVRVVNAGICAGNTTQMLEEIHGLLQQYRPDVVVMLFGMANSWNYYGFTNADNFLYRIRAYKLVNRIIQNLKYKKNGFEMFQRVDDFSNQLFDKAMHSYQENKDTFDIAYNAGRYFLSKKEWKKAISEFSLASSCRPFNDSARNALWVCTEKIDYSSYYKQSREKLIQNTLVGETENIMDSLIRIYPEAVDLQIVKYRYHITKGDTAAFKDIVQSLCQKYPDEVVFYFDLDKVLTASELKSYFESDDKSLGYFVAKGYYHLKNYRPEQAEKCFSHALELNPEEYMAQIGEFILTLQKINNKTILEDNEKDLMKNVLIKIHNLVLYGNQEQAGDEDNEKVNRCFNYYKNIIQLNGIEQSKRDSVFFYYSDYYVKHLKEMIHEDFFLTHIKKRSMSLQEQEVFRWIEKDINTLIDICAKQGYPVICMNYPLIPPPNSEEISFWAAKVGDIWEKKAKTKNLPFINQDSLFSVSGFDKSDLFEPAFTGTEHCNENGYYLMALNIYNCMKKNSFLPKK